MITLLLVCGIGSDNVPLLLQPYLSLPEVFVGSLIQDYSLRQAKLVTQVVKSAGGKKKILHAKISISHEWSFRDDSRAPLVFTAIS